MEHVEQHVGQICPIYGGARPEPRHRLRRGAPHRAAQPPVQVRALQFQVAHMVGMPRIGGVEYGGFEEADRTIVQPHASRALHVSADADREPLVEQPELAQVASHALEGVGVVARVLPHPDPPVEVASADPRRLRRIDLPETREPQMTVPHHPRHVTPTFPSLTRKVYEPYMNERGPPMKGGPHYPSIRSDGRLSPVRHGRSSSRCARHGSRRRGDARRRDRRRARAAPGRRPQST